ncbi:MAG: V-type ATP synthase subunit F [Candidatus Woesearchaeota archaeon]
MAHLAVIGKEEFTLGFMLAGVRKIYIDRGSKETQKIIEELKADPSIGIIVIQQETFDELADYIQEELIRLVKPVVVTLSKKGEAQKLREMIIKSIGVDLWQE